MKILVIDVDGVLNTTKSTTLFSLSRPRLRQLSRIVQETGCKIVLSSTWRLSDYAFNRLRTKLRYRKLFIFDKTPVINSIGITRGDEIQQWFYNTSRVLKIENYCIVDDINDMLEDQQSNFVKTDPNFGLTKEKADDVISILMKG